MERKRSIMVWFTLEDVSQPWLTILQKPDSRFSGKGGKLV